MNKFINYSVNEGLSIKPFCIPQAALGDIADVAIAATNDNESVCCGIEGAKSLLESSDYWQDLNIDTNIIEKILNLLEEDGTIVTNEYGKEINYSAAVDLMDDELRDLIHGDADINTNQQFFNKYCTAHQQKFGEVFELAKQNPVW